MGESYFDICKPYLLTIRMEKCDEVGYRRAFASENLFTNNYHVPLPDNSLL